MNERPALCAAELPRIAERRIDDRLVELPGYARRISKRICHIGVGGFHRAHQAMYLHRLAQAGLADGWGICGIGIKPFDRPLLEALARQDGLYSLWECEGDSRQVGVIGTLMQCIDASADNQPALEVLGDAATHIISLTITEAGYALDAQGRLDVAQADIAHDLRQPAQLRSAPGLLVRALAMRRDAGIAGCTLMSCDNLIENGHRLRAAVLGFAERIEPALARWIEREVRFPCSMVDRITPAGDPARRARFVADWDVDDQALLVCEPWAQWIIEDDFATQRPAYERAGAVLSDEVTRYEAMKVGLLNGGHSALSHLGLLLGYERVHDAVADPLLRGWLRGYMREVASTLQAPRDVDLGDYQRSLIRRFANPAIEDRLSRLAQDSSTKFQQTLLPPLQACLQDDRPVAHLATAIGLWLFYLDRLQSDRAARDGYLDGDKSGLIANAAAACAAGDAAGFVERRLPLATTADTTRFAGQVSQQLRALLRDGPAAHVGLLVGRAAGHA